MSNSVPVKRYLVLEADCWLTWQELPANDSYCKGMEAGVDLANSVLGNHQVSAYYWPEQAEFMKESCEGFHNYNEMMKVLNG